MASDTNYRSFDYDRFCSLAESDLVDFMEPVLNNPAVRVSADDLQKMAAEIDDYDDYHLVYAIEFGMERMPGVFGRLAARCLTHECQSVRLAAHRQLLWLPPAMVSNELIEACDRATQSARKFDDVSDIVERLRQIRTEKPKSPISGPPISAGG